MNGSGSLFACTSMVHINEMAVRLVHQINRSDNGSLSHLELRTYITPKTLGT